MRSDIQLEYEELTLHFDIIDSARELPDRSVGFAGGNYATAICIGAEPGNLTPEAVRLRLGNDIYLELIDYVERRYCDSF